MEGTVPRKRTRRPKAAGRPFWLTLAVAAVLAGVYGLYLHEPPFDEPAQVVLLVEGLH